LRSEGYSHAASGATAEETKTIHSYHRRHVPECRCCQDCEPLHAIVESHWMRSRDADGPNGSPRRSHCIAGRMRCRCAADRNSFCKWIAGQRGDVAG
jgi:hypothetical protein